MTDDSKGCDSVHALTIRSIHPNAAPSQLILPEAFKTLPAYALGLLKSKPLKERNVSADVRNVHAHRLAAQSVRGTMQHLYPRMLALHDLAPDAAVPDEQGHTAWPGLMRDSYTCMEADGVYLIGGGRAFLWSG